MRQNRSGGIDRAKKEKTVKKKSLPAKLWGIIYPPLWYMAAQVVVSFVFSVAAMIIAYTIIASGRVSISSGTIYEAASEALTDFSMWIVSISAAITAPWMICAFSNDKKNRELSGEKIRYEKVGVSKYLLIIPLAIVAMYAGSYLVSIMQEFLPDWFSAGYDAAESTLYSGSILSQVVAIVIAAPLVEEYIFRGLVYNRVTALSNKTAGMIISALLFGIFHMNFVQGTYGFLIGLLLVYVYDKYKTMAAPVIFHMSANGFSLLVSVLFSDSSSADSESPFFLISMIGLCVVLCIFTAGFLLLINQKVNPKLKEG